MRFTRIAGLAAAASMFGVFGPSAGAQRFTFKDPKGVNAVLFVLDSELEPIMGVASGIDGALTFDAKRPEATRGTITVASASVHTNNARMKKKLASPEWMNVEAHPTISFSIEKIVAAKPAAKGSGGPKREARTAKPPNEFPFVAVGSFSMRGVTRKIEAPISFRHLPEKLKMRNGRVDGDLLVVRSAFSVKRSDFGVGPAVPLVSDKVKIHVAIVGFHAVEKAGR